MVKISRKIFSKWVSLIFSVFIFGLLSSSVCAQALPEGFVYVTDVIPDARLAMIFYSEHNFTGGRVDGYHAEKAILTTEAAEALKKANEIFYEKGYEIKIIDAYRPQSAVNHFIRWAKDIDDDRMQKYFYPNIDKCDLFKLGYIAEKSTHSRGSTVDLTLVNLGGGRG